MVEIKTSATIEGLDVLNTLTDKLMDAFGSEIGKRIVETTEDSITNEIFFTKSGFATQGIVDLGVYRDSYSVDESLKPDIFVVGSTDNKAKEIEKGRQPHPTEPKDNEIIAWVRRQRFAGRRFVRIGQRIARSIRRNGIAPKPAFERGIMTAKTDNEEIKNRTVERLKKELNR